MHKGLLTILLLTLFILPGTMSSADANAMENKSDVVYAESSDKGEVDAVLYPNPAQENIFVRLDLVSPSLINSSDINIEIRSILGSSMPINMERIDASRLKITTADYPSGYYLLIVSCNDCVEGNKSVKQAFKFLKK